MNVPEFSRASSRVPPVTRRPPAVSESPPANVLVAVDLLTIPSPAIVSPSEVSIPFAMSPPEIDEVPVTPVTLNPPPVISIPPAKDEVAEPVTAKFVVVARVARRFVMVEEEKKESMVEANNEPPRIVNPLVEEMPAVSNI